MGCFAVRLMRLLLLQVFFRYVGNLSLPIFLVNYKIGLLKLSGMWMFRRVFLEKAGLWNVIWKKNSLFSASTSSSLARASRSRARKEDLGWTKAYLNCGINWFHWNSGRHNKLDQKYRGWFFLQRYHLFGIIICNFDCLWLFLILTISVCCLSCRKVVRAFG